MPVLTDPQQPDEVVRAIAEAIADSPAAVDPWWRAGVDEALED